MAVRLFQTAFTGGELSPNLHARVDFPKYQQGAERLKNMVVKPQGGASRRPGSYYIADAIDHEQRSWLFPFIFSNEQAYVLELAPFVMHFFRNRALVLGDGDGTELVTNGTFTSDLSGWTVTNTGTGSTVFNAGKARMNGGSGTTFLSQGITTVAGEQYVVEFDVTLHPVTVLVGTTSLGTDLLEATTAPPGHNKVSFTAEGTTSYLAFGVDTSGDRDVDTVTAQLAEAMAVAHPYSADEIPQLRMAQSADVLYITHQNHQPYKLLRLADVEFELRPVNLTPPPTRELPMTLEASITLAALTGTNVQVDATESVFLAGDVRKILRAGAGRGSIVTVDSATQVHLNIIDDFSELGPIQEGRWSLLGSPGFDLDPDIKGPAGAIITLTAAGNSFRSTDVGRYIRIYEGLVRITGFTSATVVTGEIVVELDVADANPAAALAGAWQIEDPIWSDDRGWPGVCVFHDDRLVMGGSLSEPLTVAGSVTGDYENFAVGADDEDAYDYPIVGPYNVIRGLVSQRSLMVMTVGGEHIMSGGDGATPHITPTSVFVQSDTSYGSAFNPAPVHVGNAVLFVTRGGTRIRELTYDFGSDSRVAPDLTILAEHLTAAGIVQIARHTVPDSYVLAVRADGALLVCAYERPEQVVAWSRWITGEAQDLTDGFYESVAVIPNACDTGDEIWAAVRRRLQVEAPNTTLTPSAASGVGVTFTAGAATFAAGHVGWTITNTEDNGKALITAFTDSTHVTATITEDFPSTDALVAGTWEIAVERRFIEVFDFALNTDAAVRYEGTAIAELSGLDHLRNERATTVFDGDDASQVVGDDGTIEVDPAAEVVEAGILYKSRIRTLRPEVGTPGGLSMARIRRIVDAIVRFYCCGPGWKIQGLETDLTGEEVSEATGLLEPVQDRRVPNLGNDRLGRIVVEQPRPFQGTVLAIGGRMEVEDDG